MLSKASILLLVLGLLVGAQAQCTFPTPVNSGNYFRSALFSDLGVYITGAATGQLTLSNTNYTLTCLGFTNNQYYGTVRIPAGFLTLYLGFCMEFRTTATNTLKGFQWGSNETALPNSLGTYPIVNLVTTSTCTHTTCCTSPAAIPNFEDAWIDTTSGNFGPGTLPSALQCEWNVATVGGAAACTTVIFNGRLTNTEFIINGTCAQIAGIYPSTTTLHYLHSQTFNSNNFMLFRNSTAATGHVTCFSYSITGTTMTATLETGRCGQTQTPTALSAGGTGLVLTLAQGTCVGGSTGTGTTGGSGGSAAFLYPSVVSLLFAAIRQL